MKKKFQYFVTAALIFSLLFGINSIAAASILNNGDLSTSASGKAPDGWEFWKYSKDNEGTMTYHKAKSKARPAFVTLTGIDNDVRIQQVVPVEPNSMYKFSAEIKADSFDDPDKVGAILSVPMQLTSSPSLQDTEGWVSAEVYIRTAGDTKEVKLSAGIGGHSALNSGAASFRNLKFEKVNAIPNNENVISIDAMNQSSGQSSSNPDSNMFIYILIGIGGVILLALLYYILAVKRAPSPDISNEEIDDALVDTDETAEAEEEKEEKEEDDDDLI